VPHLESCEPYQKLLEQAGGEPMDSQKAWQAKQAGNTYLLYSRSSIKTYLKTTAKHQLVDLFAKAVYTSTANFSSFETPEWATFFKALNYKPPDRKLLSTTLLDACYKWIKTRVQDVIKGCQYIGLIADGSTNITKERVENMSVMCNGTSYY
jgi:hypothetical protein